MNAWHFSSNLYAYVKQNPWTSWDPHGLESKKELRDQIRTLKKSATARLGDNQATLTQRERTRGRIRELEDRIAWIDTVTDWRNECLEEAKAFDRARPIDFTKTSRGTSIQNEALLDSETLDDSSSKFKDLKSNYIAAKGVMVAYAVVMLRAGSLRGATGSRTLMTKPDRLNFMFEKLSGMPAAKNAQEAMEQASSMLTKVEDAFSGVPRNPTPGLKPDGRMYPAQADKIISGTDGSLSATSRGHLTTYGANGSITITERATGKVVFQKEGGG